MTQDTKKFDLTGLDLNKFTEKVDVAQLNNKPGGQVNGDVFDPETEFMQSTINPLDEYTAPPIALKVISGREAPSCKLGDFSLTIGKAKSRKTFMVSAAIAAAAGGKALCFEGCLDEGAQTLLFDTEQSNYDLWKVVKRICRFLGKEKPANFQAKGLRKFSPAEKLKIIEYGIYHTPNLKFVVIDGIRDLLTTGINDEAEATEITAKLLKWTAELQLHVMVCLHQNKGDNNARGHVGSELTNKAETTFSVSKFKEDSEISIVETEYSRDIDFDPFAFRIDEGGLPQLCDLPTNEGGRKTVTPDRIDPQEFFRVLGAIFKREPKQAYKSLWQNIKLEFGKMDIHFGDNKAKDFLKYAENEGWINVDEKRKIYEYTRAIF